MVSEDTLRAALPRTLDGTDLPGLGARYEGKVRDNYSRADGHRFIVVTDRISAFDRVLGTLPFKGQVLNRLAAWWFDKTANVAPNHFVRVPDPNVLECVECTPILVEMVVRAYVTGTTATSIWTHYQNGSRVFCGHALPDGLKKNEKLPTPILTPTTKAPKGEHDVSGSRADILATGKVSAKDFDEAAEVAFRLFAEGARLCAERGLILVDTKYEFGRDTSGKLLVIDEIHTPDSSRFWRSATYPERFARAEDPEPLDKDFVRRHYTALGYAGDGAAPPIPDDVRVGAAARYIDAFEQITGVAFEPDLEPPLPRITKNLDYRTPMKATVLVRLKTEVLDPQGDAVRRALEKLGFQGVRGVRVGKLIEIEIDEAYARQPDLPARLQKMADEMLANPVIEDFEVKV